MSLFSCYKVSSPVLLLLGTHELCIETRGVVWTPLDEMLIFFLGLYWLQPDRCYGILRPTNCYCSCGGWTIRTSVTDLLLGKIAAWRVICPGQQTRLELVLFPSPMVY